MTFSIAITEFCICALVSFIGLELVGGHVRFSGNFTGAEHIAARQVLLPSLDSVHNIVRSVRFSWIIPDCTVNREKAFLGYSRLLDADWLQE